MRAGWVSEANLEAGFVAGTLFYPRVGLSWVYLVYGPPFPRLCAESGFGFWRSLSRRRILGRLCSWAVIDELDRVSFRRSGVALVLVLVLSVRPPSD